MKALILAAGFGTRLAPHTDKVPKALFPIAGTPLLGRMIQCLKQAGCTAIAVNTHHLAEVVAAYLEKTNFGIPVHIHYEPEILGTGGAIRNLAGFWDDAPFMVVNADILTTVDMGDVYRNHCLMRRRVTLVMHDHAPFNQVWVDPHDQIAGFSRITGPAHYPDCRQLTFTGIHVMHPDILDRIPDSGFQDIIPVYQHMIDDQIPIHAHVITQPYWRDIGTPENYRQAVVDVMAPDVFRSVGDVVAPDSVKCHALSGDGSDRRWFRLTGNTHTMILADHGITPIRPGSEVNAFVRIGTHLHRSGLPVPRIYAQDDFSGLVFLEDLGDLHFQEAVRSAVSVEAIAHLYLPILSIWQDLTLKAAEAFSPSWTCQTPTYDISLILEKECRYFVDAFLNSYLGMDINDAELTEEFVALAHATLENGVEGLIHRDFQSRNIMVHQGRPYLIDFQGARRGPIQYDLASLLIDPYVGLEFSLQEDLLRIAMTGMAQKMLFDPERFLLGYRCCCVTRNLQMLGAFGFLTRVKRKQTFKRWIPPAVQMLAHHLTRVDGLRFPKLSSLVHEISGCAAYLSASDELQDSPLSGKSGT